MRFLGSGKTLAVRGGLLAAFAAIYVVEICLAFNGSAVRTQPQESTPSDESSAPSYSYDDFSYDEYGGWGISSDELSDDGLTSVIPVESLPDVLNNPEYLPTPEDNANDPGANHPAGMVDTPSQKPQTQTNSSAASQAPAPPDPPKDTVPAKDTITEVTPYIVRIECDKSSSVRLRSSMSLANNSNIVASLKNNTALLCNADCTAKDGYRWRRVVYNGKNVYVSEQYTRATGENPNILSSNAPSSSSSSTPSAPSSSAPQAPGAMQGWQTVDGKTYYYVNGEPVTGWQVIGGVRHLFDSNGVKISKAGIDVSRYQLDIDWQAVKEAGIEFALIRVGYRGYGTEPGQGRLVLDEYFTRNMDGAAAAGIPCGVYIFTTAVNTTEALEEAAFVISAVKKYKLEYPIMYDIECTYGRCEKVSKKQFTDNTIAFLDAVKAAGYKGMYYTYKSFVQNQLEYDRLKGKYDLAIALYPSADVTDDSPVRSLDYKIWQYSSSGHIPGIKGKVDLDIQISPV